MMVPRWRRAIAAQAMFMASRSPRMSAKPWRICSTTAVSMMSWVVAPQWVQRAASPPASAESCCTSPTTG
jgi:hypothetical protein